MTKLVLLKRKKDEADFQMKDWWGEKGVDDGALSNLGYYLSKNMEKECEFLIRVSK